MKFTCNRDSILKEISIAQEIISSRNALSILSNVLLETNENNLLIKATDLKVSFETSIPVDTVTSGSTTIFCDKLSGILRSLPSGEIEFEEVENDTLFIRPLFKKIDFRLKTIPSDKFPEFQTIAEESFFELPQRDFIEMLSQTVFAVSDDETRYFMNGVYLENIEGTLNMVATDGRRLSMIKKQADTEVYDFKSIIIPPKVLHLVRKLSSGEGNLSLSVTEKNIFIHFDNQKIASALIEGQFPNYHRVIPESQSFSLSVDRNDLLEALKRVSLLVEQKSRRIYMHISESTLVLHSEESEIGVAKEEIACDYSGEEMKMALNYLYLLEPLKVIESEKVKIDFTEANKAITMYSVPAEEYFHIVMPMQLD
jgi:DNA polymerase III subunit beta